jgi:AcrR family transcriptional regulator
MKEEKETKRLLLDSAKTEFMEKGFEKASLRGICKNAGVTTGALYFFFNNKEDLFSAIVEEPYNELITLLSRHFGEHETIFSALSENFNFENAFSSEHHNYIVSEMVSLLYQNYDAFLLIIERSQGTRFENSVDEIVELVEKAYVFMAQSIARLKPNCCVNDYMCHWLSHITVDAFIHVMTHIKDEKTALVYIRKSIEFMLSGWADLVLIENK